MKKILKKVKKYLKIKSVKATFIFSRFYEKNRIKDEILIQSYDGSSISGNPYYILKEICKEKEYDSLKKYIVSNKNKINEIKNIIKKEKIANAKVIEIHSRKYCKKLTECKYLINNSTFPTYFIKKEGQIYLNTWHGTPLKAMGKDVIDSKHEIGNVQRNFAMADYLLYQNDFMFEKMKDAFFLDNLFLGKYIISGYPRNDIFYNKQNKENIKKTLHIENKKIVVYMPTWRGKIDKRENNTQADNIINTLDYLEKSLDNSFVIFTKIHNLANIDIQYDMYEKIKPFPSEYETYEFLSIADCLVTDYSSVMFDFANTKKKIILYTYDYDLYTENRGFYLDVKNMPFPIVYNKEDLYSEIKNINDNINYEEFYNKFCCYDSNDITKKICRLLINNDESNLKVIDGKKYNNQKENILIFTGALSKNGITASLKGLLNNIDLNMYNYYLTFYRNVVKRNKETLNSIPDNCYYIPIQGARDYTLSEFIASILYFKFNIETKFIKNKLKNTYQREIKRLYPTLKFKYAIDFCGYDKQPINMISYMDSVRIRFTHSNLANEQKTRNNIHIPSLKHAYKTYDKIAVVRESMKKEVETHFKNIKPDNIYTVHNVNDVKNILLNADSKLEFSNGTYSNMELEEIESILENDKILKFINIGRFSEEKGQERLLRAFKKIQEKHKNVCLFIIGGHGNKFKSILNLIDEENIKNVIIIKNLDNPYTILKKCDLFVLSSFYEGLPMTIMESLILNVPILSVDIDGPRNFLKQGYAYLVENSEEGLEDGMDKFINHQFKELKKFNSEQFNKNAIEEFYKILS